MKKLLAFIAAVCMALSLTACSGNKSSAATKKFTVGFDQDFPPFGYVADDGSFTGFDIEMATECAKKMGMEISLQPIDWDSKDMELESGTIDCIWNGFTMNGRENDYTWSKAYMDNSQVIVVRKNSGISSLAGLKGKILEAQKDSSAQHALEDKENTVANGVLKSAGKFLTVAEYNTAFMDLESGAVDAVAIDIGVANFQIKGKEDKYAVLSEHISTEQYGIGFKKGNTELKNKVEKALTELVNDGTFKKLSDKYFGYDVCIFNK